MAAYDPPTQNLSIFDADYFLPDESEPLTRKEAESMFVKNTNAFISNTLNVGGNTTLLGDLSIPSYPNVTSELQSIDTTLTGVTYYPTAVAPYVTDSTRIDNNLFVNLNSYYGNRIANYTFASSGTYRRRRVFNMVDTDAVLKIARFDNANPPILEFEGWNTADGGVTWTQQHFWQWRATNTNILVQNYVTSGVAATTTSFTFGCAGTATPTNVSNIPLDMNGQTITNVAVNSTTTNGYSEMLYDATGKNWYYKPAVYGQFSLSTDFPLTLANTEYLASFDTTTNALNCAIQSTNQIRVDVNGVYCIRVSPNIQGPATSTTTDFWFKKNGTNIPNSCSRLTTKQGNDLPFVEIIETLTATQYIQVAFSASGTGVILDASGTQTTPTRPATPAIIVTIQRIN